MRTYRLTDSTQISPLQPIDSGLATGRRNPFASRAGGSTFEAALALRQPEAVSRRNRREAKRLGVTVLLDRR